MADSAIGELIPLNLQLPKSIVQMTYDRRRLYRLASELDVIHTLCEHCYQFFPLL